MRLILKLALRNILIKPLRTAVIILCLTAVSLTFSLCLTVNIASKQIVEDQVRRGTGRADVILFSAEGMETLPELPQDMEALPAFQTSSYLQIHSIDNYKYVQKKSITVLGLDTDKAADFGMIPKCAQPQDREAVISYALSQRFGFEIGDEITLPCADGSQITLTVSNVVLSNNYLSVVPLTVIVSANTAKDILSVSGVAANVVYIDVIDDSKITELTEQLAERYPDIQVEQIMGTSEINEMISGVTSSFFVIFAVTFLMIVFIIFAFSNNIAAERLSVTGTLRSIGAEKKTAAMMLILECAVYGLIGGTLGLVLFYALKDTLVGGMLPSAEGFGGKVYAPMYIPMTGALLSVFVCCLFSLSSVLKTAKTSLRDIIFGGKETVYKPTGIAALIGAAMVVSSVALYFADLGFTANISTLAAFVTGICLVIPILLSWLSKAAAKYSHGTAFPVVRLAVIQSGTKRSAVIGTVICTAAVMLTASLYVLSCSVDKLYSVRNFDCDVIVTGLSERADRYSVITADSTELIYNTEENAEINGEAMHINIFGYDRFEMFSGISGLPDNLGSNEIALDKPLMKRLGISEGDTVTLTLKSSTARPVTLLLTAVSGCDSIYYDMRCNAAVISLDNYISVYHDYPSMLLLDTDDTALAMKQLTDNSAEAMTAADYYARSDEEASSVTMLLYELAALGMLLAIISICGSQTIGFTQRKHELAVLRSQGMSIVQLSEMLVIEAVMTAAVPVFVFAAAGHTVTALLTRILGSVGLNIPVSYKPIGLVMFIAIMVAAVIMTALIPICSLGNMNTAAELKQE